MSFIELPPEPSPSSPARGVTEDGKIVYGELDPDYQEVIPSELLDDDGNIDPRGEGRVTASIPIQFAGPFFGTPDPHAPQLVEAHRTSELMIARDLGIGLAGLASTEQLERDARAARRQYDPRRGRR